MPSRCWRRSACGPPTKMRPVWSPVSSSRAARASAASASGSAAPASSRSGPPGPRSRSVGTGRPRSALVSKVPEKASTSCSARRVRTSSGDRSGRSTAPAWEVSVTVPATSATAAPAGSQRVQVRAMGSPRVRTCFDGTPRPRHGPAPRTERARATAGTTKGWRRGVPPPPLPGRSGADVRAGGGPDDQSQLALGEHAVLGERAQDVAHVPHELAVGGVVAVLVDEVVDRAAVTEVGVGHPGVEVTDDDGLAGVTALARLGVRVRVAGLDDGETDRALGGVARLVGGPVVEGVLAGLADDDGAVVGRVVGAVEAVLDSRHAGVVVGGGEGDGRAAEVVAVLVLRAGGPGGDLPGSAA